MNTIFITGVSRGLGLALTKSLQSSDAKIVGLSRTKGASCGRFYTCDMEDHLSIEPQLKTIFAEQGLTESDKIVFINNAGRLGPLKRIENISPAEIHSNLTTNLTASAIALSSFLAATCKIDCSKLFINISSGASSPERPKASWSLYCASKAGQDQLIRAVAKEQETSEFPATLINFNPGVMETRMQEEIRSTSKEIFPDVERFIGLKESGKIPSPTEIADKLAAAIENEFRFKNGLSYTPGEIA